jgi:hypothetical protein
VQTVCRQSPLQIGLDLLLWQSSSCFCGKTDCIVLTVMANGNVRRGRASVTAAGPTVGDCELKARAREVALD